MSEKLILNMTYVGRLRNEHNTGVTMGDVKMSDASEVKRWWVRVKNYDASPVKRDRDRLCCDYEPEPQELEAFVEVIEAEPVLARIKQLEAQLKEANELLQFYSQGGSCSTDVWQREHLGYFTGKRARHYLEKYKERKP